MFSVLLGPHKPVNLNIVCRSYMSSKLKMILLLPILFHSAVAFSPQSLQRVRAKLLTLIIPATPSKVCCTIPHSAFTCPCIVWFSPAQPWLSHAVKVQMEALASLLMACLKLAAGSVVFLQSQEAGNILLTRFRAYRTAGTMKPALG